MMSYSSAQLRAMRQRREGRSDWQKLRSLSDADIDHAVAEDADAFMPDADWWAHAMVVLPPATAKVPLSIRLDPEIIEFFKAQGPGYQSRINAVLRSYVEAKRKVSGGR
jgi:uncharacterized protein (DUF4415 family)